MVIGDFRWEGFGDFIGGCVVVYGDFCSFYLIVLLLVLVGM